MSCGTDPIYQIKVANIFDALTPLITRLGRYLSRSYMCALHKKM